MVETALKNGILKAGMNDLAGRLNETPGRLFSFLCIIRDRGEANMPA